MWGSRKARGSSRRSELKAAKILGGSRGDGERQMGRGSRVRDVFGDETDVLSCWMLIMRRETMRADYRF